MTQPVPPMPADEARRLLQAHDLIDDAAKTSTGEMTQDVCAERAVQAVIAAAADGDLSPILATGRVSLLVRHLAAIAGSAIEGCRMLEAAIRDTDCGIELDGSLVDGIEAARMRAHFDGSTSEGSSGA